MKNDKRKPAVNLDSMVYGMIPPQAKHMEEAVLGACMLQSGAFDRAAEYLKPESFYVDAHQRIFGAMAALRLSIKPIDTLTVTEQLRSSGDLEDVGGEYYVTSLTNHVVSSAHIEAHSEVIRDKYQKRELIRICSEKIKEAYEDGEPATELFSDLDKQTSVLSSETTKNIVPYAYVAATVLARARMLAQKNEDVTGIASGFPSLDRVTAGWQDTDLIILAARPAVGKTAFALNLARNAVMHPTKPSPVAFFSLEMSKEQLVQRIMSAESDIWVEKISRGKITDQEGSVLWKRSVQDMQNAGLFIDDTPALNIFELRAKCRRLKNKHNIGMVIIDYLQLMSGTGNERNGNREQEISNISRNLKAIAKEIKVPIIALSQLSRAVEQRGAKDGRKEPQLSDLRESGAIEQDADMVMFLYRPEYYGITGDEMGESTQGLTEVKIAKHRNGSLETVKLKALLHIQKFVEWEGAEPVSNQFPAGGSWKPVAEVKQREDLF